MDSLPEQWECTFLPGLNCDTPEDQADSGDESIGEYRDMFLSRESRESREENLAPETDSGGESSGESRDDESSAGAIASEDEDYDYEHVIT